MKHIKIFAILCSLALAAGFTACNDNDDIKQPLDSPEVTQGNASYQSLSFSWDKVADAVQYGYRLIDPNGLAVKADVTQKTSVTFTGLLPSTTYTLEVWAFAGMDSDYSTPPAITLTATTDGLLQLTTPVVTATSENGLTFLWDPIYDAITYSYIVTDSEGAIIESGTTENTYVHLSGLPNGEYSISVTALGHDGYSDSAPAIATGVILVSELYRVEGTYHSAELDSSWTATMVAYSDNTYSILSFYGVEGYNLDFSVNAANSDDMFTIINGEYVNDTAAGYVTWQVPTGLSDPSMLIAYPWYNYSYWEGDSQSGSVNIGCYHGANYAEWDYDTFTWPAVTDDDPLAKITGTFKNHFVGGSSINDNWEWEEIDATDWQATILKIDDEIVEIDGLYWVDNPIYGIVDLDAGTITIEPQEYGIFYTFASTSGPTDSVVATINADGSITFPDICLWYYFDGSGWYYYMSGTATLTK
ncbi:MAG: fibronectin type III domain-containing protein [Muribaculaceae bacterium]|nr:fibronectin type III domain-containing protein [Muribaculaceae bacterium]